MRFASLFLAAIITISACEDEVTDESGTGTIVVHTKIDTGGAAAGVATYIIRDSEATERRMTTDQNGNATYQNVPAGTWDVGFFETSQWVRTSSPSRVNVEVRNDGIVELTLTARRP